MRLLLAAVLGGLVMFVWSAVGHMFLGIGEAGVMPMPNEAVVTSTLNGSLKETGIYFLPGMAMNKKPAQEEWEAWTAKYKQGPNGMLIYRTTGDEPMSAKQLGVELASNIAAALVVGMILVFANVSWGRNIIISTLVGLAAWLSINV